MSFEIGREKTGGRQKGTPNKRSVQLAEILEEKNIDLPSMLFEILPALLPETQVDVLLQLMPYVYVKRKAVEIETGVEAAHGLEPCDIEMLKRAKAMSPEQLKAEINQLNRTREIIEAENRSIAEAKITRDRETTNTET